MFNSNAPATTSTFGTGFGTTAAQQQPATTSFFGAGFGTSAPASATAGTGMCFKNPIRTQEN
jgi:hypothetical protein